MSNSQQNTVVTSALSGRRISEMSGADYLKAVAQATAGLSEDKSNKRKKPAGLLRRSSAGQK
jgi:hypothetical protein